MAKAKKDPDQFQRFKEAVREFGADESTETLDKAMKRVFRAPKEVDVLELTHQIDEPIQKRPVGAKEHKI